MAAGVRSQVDAPAAEVALTFDDGPDPEYTPRLLQILDRLGVRATFFTVGEAVRRHPPIVRDINSSGHALGSHSYSHPDPWALSPKALKREYILGRHVLEDVCGRPVHLFRPPKGHLDAAGVLAIRSIGLRPWLWTIDSHDWEPGASPGSIERRAAIGGPGDVLLFHDAIRRPVATSTLDRSATLEALPAIVARLRDAGVRFTTLF